MDYVFHPRSIAVIGVSEAKANTGRDFLSALIDFSYPGTLYAVNPKGGQVLGNRIFKSLSEVPGLVDYVISCVPAQSTVSLLEECVSAHVKVVHLFTAGFRELDETGAEIEARLAEVARQGGVRIIGPNGMGVYYPAGGMSFAASLPREKGGIAFISQSGGNAAQAIRLGNNRALGFSKVVSYGNALDLNESDFLEYCTDDPETSIIAAYIEGVRDGSAFLRALKRAAGNKPTILVKGGRGKAGARAIASHTGSLASGEAVWESVFKQTHAVRANTIEEMIDTIHVFQRYPKTLGRRVGILGFGGGAGVLAADACETAGLVVPLLDSNVQEKLKHFTFFSNPAGSIFTNPVDSPLVVTDNTSLLKIMDVLGESSNIDWILGILRSGVGADVSSRERALMRMAEAFIEYGRSGSKPLVLVVDPIASEAYPNTIAEIRKTAFKAGILICLSFDHAAHAVSRAVEFRERGGWVNNQE
jgi:acyl-CoA synthetase (NDP forming)